MKEAFDNFKVSTELEQTKRMRQIGDFISTQQRLLGQISFNEKNYLIFQKTSEQLCNQIVNILELMRLQNSLNLQEEKDKNSIALYGQKEANEFVPAQKGGKLDMEADKFVKKKTLSKSGLAFNANLLETDQLGSAVHLELDARCQICSIDPNQRHLVQKAFKKACLRYRSSKVEHYGHAYDRMKLISI